VTFIGVGLLTLLAGASTGVAYVLATNGSLREIPQLIAAAFVQVPAVITLAGLVVAVYGLFPRVLIGFAWGCFILFVVMGQLGAILKLPQWLLNLSPFSHLPIAPAEAVTLTPILALAAFAASLVGVGFWAFRHRDLGTA
jgi:ABC-2 type transport system permease protein